MDIIYDMEIFTYDEKVRDESLLNLNIIRSIFVEIS